VTSPAAYVALLGWPAAAVVMSLACARATRLGAALGAIAGTATLAGFYALAEWLSSILGSPGQWVGNDLAIALGGSLILVLLVTALGAPIRAEEDEP
jgi:hypothetical protein